MKALLYIPTNTICKLYFSHKLSYDIDKFKTAVHIEDETEFTCLSHIIETICNESYRWNEFYKRNKLPDTVSPEEFEIIDIKEDLIP